MSTAVFYILGFTALVSAIGVIAFRNPLHSALALVTNLLAIAGFYAQMDAHFLAAVQILIYAGAVMVLVLFVMLLLNTKVESLKKQSRFVLAASAVSGAALLSVAAPVMYEQFSSFDFMADPVEGTVSALGKIIFNDYVYLFQASGIILLVALVAAVSLASRKQSGGAR